MSDLGSTNYSETDASNDANPPNGWPEGMQPSDVNNSARANMGATKRFWDQINAVKTSAGATTAFTLTYDVAAGALYDGELTSFVADRDCVAAATLNKNGLGAKAVHKFTSGAWAAVADGDWLAGQVVTVRYKLSDTTYQIVSVSTIATDFVQLAADNDFTGTDDFTGGRIKVPTRTNGDNGTDAASTAFVTAMLRSYLAGLGTSNNAGTPNSKIDVAAGVCMDDGNAALMVFTAGTIDCTTVGANGLDAGALANSTWYNAFGIGKTDGTRAFLASTSLTPTMPAGYTLKRRIGSFLTDGSAHIIAFLQFGDFFQWLAPVVDVNANNPGISAVSRALTVPSGVSVLALVQAILGQGDASVFSCYLSDLATNDIAPTTALATMANSANFTAPTATLTIRTNTSRQIRSRLSGSSGATTLTINTLGWYDRRGRDS